MRAEYPSQLDYSGFCKLAHLVSHNPCDLVPSRPTQRFRHCDSNPSAASALARMLDRFVMPTGKTRGVAHWSAQPKGPRIETTLRYGDSKRSGAEASALGSRAKGALMDNKSHESRAQAPT